jgi:hypothetical protein
MIGIYFLKQEKVEPDQMRWQVASNAVRRFEKAAETASRIMTLSLWGETITVHVAMQYAHADQRA